MENHFNQTTATESYSVDTKIKMTEERIIELNLDDPIRGGDPPGNDLFPWNDAPMPFWVEALFRRPGSNTAYKMTYRNTNDGINKYVKHKNAPDIPRSARARREWRSDDSQDNLSASEWKSKIRALGVQKERLEEQCKFNNAYDSAIGFGWGSRCGQASYRMRYREFCLARSDPSHPTEIAARPTHLVAYKRIGTWPSRYPHNQFKPDKKNYMDDAPRDWGAKWVKTHDTSWDKSTQNQTHVDGPITATESYPRIERIEGGIAYV